MIYSPPPHNSIKILDLQFLKVLKNIDFTKFLKPQFFSVPLW